VPIANFFTSIFVAIVTVIRDLAIAVIVGVVVSALVSAWEHAKQMQAKSFVDENSSKINVLNAPYSLHQR
jgi:sulfate permease, SulP family